MFDPLHEPSFRLEIAGQSQPLAVVAFSGSEAISQPYAFLLDLHLDERQLDLSSLMFRAAYLCFGTATSGIHGQIQDLVPLHDEAQPGLWRVTLGPRLGSLARRFTRRLFSGLSVPQILAQVLSEHGIDGQACRFELRSEYPALAFCTQYCESDLAFVQRLCGQQSIDYHFRHRRRGHCLVFTDSGQHDGVADTLSFGGDGAAGVRRFAVHTQADGIHVQAETEQPTVRAGQRLSCAGHPCTEGNGPWLITRVEHRASPHDMPRYHNRLRAIAWGVPYVPAEPPEKPRMSSLQLGWVVSVDGQHRDAQQRIAVQMEWLYQGEGGRPSHCWLPVSAHLSAQAINGLRAGVQVCVSYTEGDPDQPLISGVLVTPQQTGVDQAASDSTAAPSDAARLQLQISAAAFMGREQQLQVSPGSALVVGPGAERQFKVGCSEVSIVGETLHLSSPNLHLKAMAPPLVEAPIATPEEVPAVAAQDLLALLRSSQPLVLLCLLPGGGSYSHCRQSICVCRTAAGDGLSGAA
ncbi:contractile injection system protein, VgrG/Pvc8 family [Pseudomonas kielensis]|uniref:type VI secretion system Vgr family protein n=1 Tax=Pseudomonas kielensis TaxID=2762577 RepID=UPI00265E7788|nr:contractile injection system protein, VgrG/Pvc8 family [Pseudomonas kielensis]WKL54334.1 contractile injection system protein, VgrG/Pvc8 family [Pseudomonas kielensis]